MSEIQVNTINEYTSANGVTIDGVLIKDGEVDGVDVSGITQGITEVDIWAVTANYTGDAVPISSNWARYTDDGAGYTGTGMSESSGIFTFPSTGIWKIEFHHSHYAEDAYDVRRVFGVIQTTLDNSSYNDAAFIEGSINSNAQVGDHFSSGNTSFIFVVTDTSNL
jgi:hypothetical protein